MILLYIIPLYAFLSDNFSPFAPEIRIFGSNFDNRMRFKAHVLKLESVPTTYSGQSYSKVVSLAHRNLLHCHVENNEPFRRRIERMSYRNFILSWIRFLFTTKPIILDYVFVWPRREIHHTRRNVLRAVYAEALQQIYVRTYIRDRAWRRQNNVHMFTRMYLRTDAVLEVKLSESCARSHEQIEAARSFTWQWSPAGDSASH